METEEIKIDIAENIYKKLDYAKTLAAIEPDKSIKISYEMYRLADLHQLKLEKAYSLLNIAFASRVKSDTSIMLENSFKALSIFKEEDNIIGQIKSLNLIGISYFYSSMYDDALRCFLEGRDMLELDSDDFLLSRILNNIGEVYRESKIYDKAIEYYNEAIDIVYRNNYYSNHAVLLLNVGEIYFEKNELNKALEAYNKSYKILLDTNEMVFLADTENKIGRIHFEMGNFVDAENFYLEAFNRLKNVDNKYYIIDVLINLAQLYEVNSKEKTLEFYEDAMYIAIEIGSNKKLCNIYILISEYYEKLGDYKKSLLYYKKYFNINEELMNSGLKDKLEILNIDFKNIHGSGKVNNIRIRLEKEIERQRKEIEKIKLSNTMLEKKAYEDELTGIANRRSVNLYLQKIFSENHLNKEKITLFMIDIDKFKKYNDYWGHSQGDICIKKIANCIRRIQIENGDIFGRYGGEEFIYITTSKTYEQAIELGDFIRTEVEKLGLYYKYQNKKKSTTISIGGVISDILDINSTKEIIELADKELYRAKERGRNITILKNINANKRL